MQFGTTNSGKPSAKMNGGVVKGWRKLLKIKHIALLEAQLYSDTEIAFHIGVTPQYVRMLKNTPEYVTAKITAATNILSETEKQSLSDIKARQQALKDMVPDALHAIRDTLLNSSNPTLRLKAAQDLLDREGTLAKVSRTEVSIPKELDLTQHDKTANTLLSALNNLNAPKQPEQAQILETSEDVQGVDEFVSADTANLSEDQQKIMQDAMDLISKSADEELKSQSKYVN